jgi:hypothetical protein
MPKLPKNKFLLIIILFLSAVGLLALFSLMFSTQGVAIRVGDQTVSKAFFDKRIAIQTNFYTNVSANPDKLKTVKKDEAEAIVETILGEVELKKNNNPVTDQEIEKELENKQKTYEEKNAPALYKDYLLTTYGMTLADERYVIKRKLVKDKLVAMIPKKHLYGIWFNRPVPSDDPSKATDAQKAEDQAVLAKANAVLVKVKAGENFAKLVAENSDDPISKAKDGDLGIYPYEQMETTPQPFPSLGVVDTAAKELGKGEAKLYVYPFGYSIVKATEAIGSWPYKSYEDFVKQAKGKVTVKTYVKID